MLRVFLGRNSRTRMQGKGRTGPFPVYANGAELVDLGNTLARMLTSIHNDDACHCLSVILCTLI